MQWADIPSYIDPVAFRMGPVAVRWYGLMYLAAFATVWLTATSRLRHERSVFSKQLIEDFLFWAICGVLAGGRLGYVLLYDLKYFAAYPLSIILPFDFRDGLRFTGIYGMSYHGGLLGLIVSGVLFCRRYRIDFWQFADFLAPSAALGYFWGRIGNFLNGELYGRITSVPWAMIFPQDPLQAPRHPSQLYEAFGEGLLLFLLLTRWRQRPLVAGELLCRYMISYGLIRFFLEFTREPDAHLGFILLRLSLGQLLCVGMVCVGTGLLLWRRMVKHGTLKTG